MYKNIKHSKNMFSLYPCRIASEGHKGPRPRRSSEPSADEEDLQLLTPEEREMRKKFEQKRKAHYNEFYAVKMARQLMDSDDESEKETDSNGTNSSAKVTVSETASNDHNQSSTTSAESSADANLGSTDISNTKDTKTNPNLTVSSEIVDIEKASASSVPMDTSYSPH